MVQLKGIDDEVNNMNIRRAVLTDAASIAHVHVKSWQQSYKGLVDSDYLEQMSIKERTAKWEQWLRQGNSHIVLVLEDNERNLCGFISGGAIRSHHPYAGEVYAFYLLKHVQQKGLGSKMLRMFVTELAAIDKNSMIVWVLRDNPAKQAYISFGGKKIDEEQILIGKQELVEECFAWFDLQGIHT